MLKLSDEQRRIFETDGYLHLEGALNPDEVSFFISDMERIRQIPGFEPSPDPELPIGHYQWQDHSKVQEVNGFMDRHNLHRLHGDWWR